MPRADEYLLIENKGEAPVEGYTLLGWSSARDAEEEGVIGQFGSGSKHAIALCLRYGLSVWVYCGKTRLEFGCRKETINDGLTETDAYRICYRKNNNEWRDTDRCLDFGVLDWDDTDMAVREFISNAIDRTIREDGGFDKNHMVIKPVEDKERRAKAGFTRIYIELNDDVRAYYGNLGKHFLHFSDNPEARKPGILAKAGRSPEGADKEGAVIYREGVYVRTMEGKSLYDYNFGRDELKIDECRNSSDYHVKAAIARKIGNADAGTLSSIMRAAQQDDTLLETTIDHDYMFGRWRAEPTETQQETWARAWEAAAGPDAVVCDDTFSKDYVEKKGYKPKVIGGSWSRSLRKTGAKVAEDILNEDEQAGRTILDPTEAAIAAVDWAWEILELCGLTGEKEKPPVKCFQEISKAAGIKSGFYKEGTVFIHVDIANDGINNELRKTAVEELTHYVTGATDNSRDFQNFLIDALVIYAG